MPALGGRTPLKRISQELELDERLKTTVEADIPTLKHSLKQVPFFFCRGQSGLQALEEGGDDFPFKTAKEVGSRLGAQFRICRHSLHNALGKQNHLLAIRDNIVGEQQPPSV